MFFFTHNSQVIHFWLHLEIQWMVIRISLLCIFKGRINVWSPHLLRCKSNIQRKSMFYCNIRNTCWYFIYNNIIIKDFEFKMVHDSFLSTTYFLICFYQMIESWWLSSVSYCISYWIIGGFYLITSNFIISISLNITEYFPRIDLLNITAF